MENSENIVIKSESKNKNLGKFDKKSIYLNHGKYGYFLNHNKINYQIPEWLPIEKIDLEIASNLIQHKLRDVVTAGQSPKYQENKKDSNDSE